MGTSAHQTITAHQTLASTIHALNVVRIQLSHVLVGSAVMIHNVYHKLACLDIVFHVDFLTITNAMDRPAILILIVLPIYAMKEYAPLLAQILCNGGPSY
jgi:hypothetical protein